MMRLNVHHDSCACLKVDPFRIFVVVGTTTTIVSYIHDIHK